MITSITLNDSHVGISVQRFLKKKHTLYEEWRGERNCQKSDQILALYCRLYIAKKEHQSVQTEYSEHLQGRDTCAGFHGLYKNQNCFY